MPSSAAMTLTVWMVPSYFRATSERSQDSLLVPLMQTRSGRMAPSSTFSSMMRVFATSKGVVEPKFHEASRAACGIRQVERFWQSCRANQDRSSQACSKRPPAMPPASEPHAAPCCRQTSQKSNKYPRCQMTSLESRLSHCLASPPPLS